MPQISLGDKLLSVSRLPTGLRRAPAAAQVTVLRGLKAPQTWSFDQLLSTLFDFERFSTWAIKAGFKQDLTTAVSVSLWRGIRDAPPFGYPWSQEMRQDGRYPHEGRLEC